MNLDHLLSTSPLRKSTCWKSWMREREREGDSQKMVSRAEAAKQSERERGRCDGSILDFSEGLADRGRRTRVN
jgi:hypothetical protein